MSRDKIFSEYTKLTSTERELKGANEQIRILLNENRSIRETFKQQSDVIIKLQDTIKKLAKHVDSLHKTQESQAAKIAAL